MRTERGADGGFFLSHQLRKKTKRKNEREKKTDQRMEWTKKKNPKYVGGGFQSDSNWGGYH